MSRISAESLFLTLCFFGLVGCSQREEVPVSSASAPLAALPSAAAPVPVSKPVKTPEAECSEVIAKFKEKGFWSASGMTDAGKQSLIQDVYVGNNGVLELGLCDWFWTLGADQTREWLEAMQSAWAGVHSPDAPCRSRLSCWIPDMKNESSIPVKVSCKGLDGGELKRIADETRGRLSEKKLKRYQTEEFSELKNRPK